MDVTGKIIDINRILTESDALKVSNMMSKKLRKEKCNSRERKVNM